MSAKRRLLKERPRIEDPYSGQRPMRKKRRSTMEKELLLEINAAFPIKIEIVYAANIAQAEKNLKKMPIKVLERLGIIIANEKVAIATKNLDVQIREPERISRLAAIKEKLVSFVAEKTLPLAETTRKLVEQAKEFGMEASKPAEILASFQSIISDTFLTAKPDAKHSLPQEYSDKLAKALQKGNFTEAFKTIITGLLRKHATTEQFSSLSEKVSKGDFKDAEKFLSKAVPSLPGLLKLLKDTSQFLEKWKDARDLQVKIFEPISQISELFKMMKSSFNEEKGELDYTKFQTAFKSFASIKLKKTPVKDTPGKDDYTAVDLLSTIDKLLDKVLKDLSRFKDPETMKKLNESDIRTVVSDLKAHIEETGIVSRAQQLRNAQLRNKAADKVSR